MFYEWYWISLSDPIRSAARELTAARNPISIGDGIIWKGTCHEPDQPWCRKTKPSEHASWYIPRTTKIGNGHRDICHVASHGSWLGLCALKPSVIHYNPLAVWVVIPFLLKRKKVDFASDDLPQTVYLTRPLPLNTPQPYIHVIRWYGQPRSYCTTCLF